MDTTVDGTYVTRQNDGTGDSEYRTSGDLVHKFVTTWTQSFDGQSYGNNVNTLVESWDTTSTISDHADYESTYASKVWNSSGIISQSSGTYGYHESTDTDTSDLTETTETNDGFSPQYLMDSVLGLMTITPVNGWNPSTATTFIFSTPTLSVSGASDAASLTLPDLVMTTTSFAALGVAADTRTMWQELADLVISEVDCAISKLVNTVVWVSDVVEGALTWAGNKISDIGQKTADFASAWWNNDPNVLAKGIALEEALLGDFRGGWFASTSNFAAGMGDSLSFGASSFIRSQGGFDRVDYGSGAYMGGAVTGAALSIAIGIGAGSGACQVSRLIQLARAYNTAGVINGIPTPEPMSMI